MTGARRWYFFHQKRGSHGAQPSLYTFQHEDGLGFSEGDYSQRYFRSDPLSDALSEASADDDRLIISVAPDDIVNTEYRARYLDAGNIVQRVSLAHAHDEAWQILNIGRDGTNGDLGPRALRDLWAFSQLAFPLVQRHCALSAAARPVIDIDDIERQARIRCPDLSRREAEVCARTVMGLSCKSISRELGIGMESVATYRKRAYVRLGVSSAEQLSRRIFPLAEGQSATNLALTSPNPS